MLAEYFADWLTQSARIERRAPARGGYTDSTPTWSLVAADVPCLVRPLRNESRAVQSRDVAKVWARIYFLADPGVTKDHRIVVGTTVYAPDAAIDTQSQDGVWYVDCTEIRG